MAEYELCCEIFNQCSNNQMRDVDFQEVSVEDTEAYVRSLEPRAEIEREAISGGAGAYHTNTDGMRKSQTFPTLCLADCFCEVVPWRRSAACYR